MTGVAVEIRQRDLLDECSARGVFVEEDKVARAAEVYTAVAALDGDQVARGERLQGGFDEGDPVRRSDRIDCEVQVGVALPGRVVRDRDEVAAGGQGRAGEAGRGGVVAARDEGQGHEDGPPGAGGQAGNRQRIGERVRPGHRDGERAVVQVGGAYADGYAGDRHQLAGAEPVGGRGGDGHGRAGLAGGGDGDVRPEGGTVL